MPDTVSCPDSIIVLACLSCAFDRREGRPRRFPLLWAASKPALVRSEIRLRSNCDREPIIWNRSIPPGVVVSIFSDKEWKPIPLTPSFSMTWIRCCSDLPNLSNFHTTRTSPGFKAAKASSKPCRSLIAPDTPLSVKILSQPAPSSASCCRLRFC